jgi:ABC-type transport system involved in multi-copper enzyme maturation permease subunit
MTLTASPALAADRHTRTNPAWQVLAEWLKIRTTSAWRWFLLALVLLTGQALARNGVTHHYELHPPLDRMAAADRAQAISRAAEAHTYAGHVAISSDMMTSGQFAGGLLTMLLAILVVTGETTHRTAIATYLVNPHAERVLAAKLGAMAGVAGLFWATTTIIDTITNAIYIRGEGFNVAGSDPVIVRSVLLNLLAYVMWAAFGVGLASLLRGQTLAVVIGTAIYFAGTAAAALLANLAYQLYPHSWVLGAPVVAPAVAAQVMVNPGRVFEHAPPQWAGLVVMAAYTVVLTLAGVLIARRRDVG